MCFFVAKKNNYEYNMCYTMKSKGVQKLSEKKRYTFSFTEDTAEKFEELVKFYSIQKSGVVTLLIREAYEKNIDGKESEQKK